MWAGSDPLYWGMHPCAGERNTIPVAVLPLDNLLGLVEQIAEAVLRERQEAVKWLKGEPACGIYMDIARKDARAVLKSLGIASARRGK